ncbi:MAG: DUF2793 domain-containing protein [Pseudomonadota bacterium]
MATIEDSSENLSLPYIMPAQAQKHVTHNEAIRMLDALVQLAFSTMGENTPPANPVAGERHWTGTAPINEWLGKPNQIAAWQDGFWAFLEPKPGWLARDLSNRLLLCFDGSTWVEAVASPSSLQNMASLGINASADETNRLVVGAPSSLLTHEGAGHQLKINKNSSSDTASILFQTGWSGRAEFGLTGDDDWRVKVSPNGADWIDALIADQSTGGVTFPQGMKHALSGAPLSSQIFTPGGANISTIWRFDEPRTGFPRAATINNVSGDIITLADGNRYGNDPNTGVPIIIGTGPVASRMFFSHVMQGLSYLRLWNMSKSPPEACWIEAAPAASDLRVIDSTHIAGWLPGETVQLGEPNLNGAKVVAVDISQFLHLHTGAIFPQAGLALMAGISAQGTGGWNGHIGVTPDATGGSFSNVTSASADHDTAFSAGHGTGGGFVNAHIQVGTTLPSPISNSNLVFVREFDAGAGGLRIGALTAVGVWV